MQKESLRLRRERERERAQDLPSLDIYQKLWKEKYSAEQHTPLQPSIQLVLGVMTYDFPGEKSFEDVGIATWMNQMGVCPASRGQKDGCSVYVAFVFGRSSEQVQHDDWRLWLSFPEGLNNGKTPAFFKHAVESFTWATHIGKMDMDTYPYLPKLVSSLAQRDSKFAYIGRPTDYKMCGSFDFCPPAGCGYPMNERLEYTKENCWSYMQGGLYIMSSSLAKLVVQNAQWKNGTEDLETGRAVHRTHSNGAEIAAWNPDAWDHLRSTK